MSLGFKSTLFAGVITLSAFAPAFAAAPMISNLPDVTIGDLEDSTEATDNNIFVFSDAFTFSDFVSDADSNDSELMWSFGEFSDDDGTTESRYAINGVTAINVGDDQIAADAANDHQKALNPGVNQVNINTNVASFRDIVLSPPGDSAPYPDPSVGEEPEVIADKVVRYYVSDGDNVAYNDATVRSVHNDYDSTSGVYNEEYQEVERDDSLDSDGWEPSGFAWEKVSVSRPNGELAINVQPAQAQSRFYGWTNPALMSYDDVGADRFVRGKFYIYTDVDLIAPINQLPNFRLRITHENAVNAAAHFELATTGYSDPGYEPFYAGANNPTAEGTAGFFLRPADNFRSPTPSLYRVDFDPVDVPAAAGSNIGALMESYTVHDTADGSLFLTEVVLGTYNALDNSGDLEWSYNRADGFDGGVGGPKAATGGGFNHEPDLTAGYLQELYMEPGEPGGGYFQITGNDAEDVGGVVGDTDAVNSDVFGIGLLNFQSTDNVNKLRIESNKLYHARFYATAPVPSTSATNEEIQGGIRFRFQTAANTVSYLLDMTTLAFGSLNGPNTPNADDIAAQALPGTTSQNPDTDANLDTAGEGGGWYSVVVPSPIDYEGIRNDVVALYGNEEGFDETGQFFILSGQAGPNSSDNSAKDVTLGVDFIQPPLAVTVAGGQFTGGVPARAVVRVSAIEVYSYPSIDDGGFDTPPTSVHP